MAVTLDRSGVPVAPTQRDSTTQQRIGKIVAWVVLIGAAILALFPLYWLFVSALTPTQEVVKTPPDFIPVNASIENFRKLFDEYHELTRTIEKMEDEVTPVATRTEEEHKIRRVHLKDELYRLLTAAA